MNSIDDHNNEVRRYLDHIEKALKPRRVIHTKNVAAEAIRLAKKHGADVQKAEKAAILHDIARNLPMEEMNRYVDEFGLDPHYINNKNLAHSKIGVELIKRDFGIEDKELLDAVSYHTTGRSNMTLLDKIVFLADAAEPGRNYPGVEQLRKLIDEDLDKACAYSLRRTKNYVEGKGDYLDPDTLEALEYFERKIKTHE